MSGAGLSAFGRSAAGQDATMASWWYCLSHHTVEQEHECRLGDRLGPYPTREDAEQALQRARQRTEEEDERDRRESDWGTPPPRS